MPGGVGGDRSGNLTAPIPIIYMIVGKNQDRYASVKAS